VAALTPTLSPDEAAAIIGCCAKTLGKFRDAGAIKAINLGTGRKRPCWRYHPDDVAAFLADRRRTVEHASCPSTNRRDRRTGTTTFSSTVVDIMARLERATGERRPGSSRTRDAAPR